MKIKNKITFFFSIIVVVLLLVFSIIIFVFSSNYREEQFFERLKDKSITTARLLFEVEQVDSLLLKIIDNANQTLLFQEKIVIFDESYSKIYDSRDELELKIDRKELQEIGLDSEKRFTKDGHEIHGMWINEGGRFYCVVASAYDKYGYSKIENLLKIIVIGLLFSIMIILITGRLFAEKLIFPIKKIVQQVEEFEVGTIKKVEYNGKSQDEIFHLALAFNNMLLRLEGAIKIQKNFVANASHELRTPLTSLRGQIDVALMKTRTTTEYQNILQSIKEDISGFIDLSNKLLMLAQTNTSLPTFSVRVVRIDEILWQAKQDVVLKNPNSVINISFRQQIEDELLLKYYGSELLLRSALINLLDNACKYSQNHVVDVLVDATVDRIEIQFVNNTQPLLNNEKENLFEPFYRAANSVGVEGHGVGLPLVKNIVHIHEGIIKVSFIEGNKICFTLIIEKEKNSTLKEKILSEF